jgi:hypothetical protein
MALSMGVIKTEVGPENKDIDRTRGRRWRGGKEDNLNYPST